jgi:uncharacterized membrane protein YhaH (DUF805 family)
MDFQTSIRTCLQKYATFTGRARRSEFWWFVLFGILVNIAASIVDSILFGHSSYSGMMGGGGMHMGYDGGIIGSIASLALLLPNLAVGARRLHDIGRSGWWMLIALIPVIGWILLIVWYARQSDAGENAFGPAA